MFIPEKERRECEDARRGPGDRSKSEQGHTIHNQSCPGPEEKKITRLLSRSRSQVVASHVSSSAHPLRAHCLQPDYAPVSLRPPS